VSELVLDELLAGELDRATRAGAEAHLAQCAQCRVRAADRERERVVFLERAPTFADYRALAGREPTARTRRARTRWAATAAGALALVAGALLLVRPPPEAPGTRSKGAAHIGFFIKRGERVARGSSGQAVHPGDELRFVYTSARDVHLALLNVDAHATSVYYPSTASESSRVRAGADVPLDFSVELDARIGPEQVHALFCPEPFALEPVRAALQTGSPLPKALEACTHDTIQLEKQVPR
jgi:hypothetical protein